MFLTNNRKHEMCNSNIKEVGFLVHVNPFAMKSLNATYVVLCYFSSEISNFICFLMVKNNSDFCLFNW